tara:strand:- start:2543 stop:3556 length:1014 start_codon:yes stop_codon:yes gene_type:complete
MSILVTGSAGFIGFALSKRLLDDNFSVIGVDNHNDYYDQKLKNDRVEILSKYNNYSHQKMDISDRDNLEKVFLNYRPKKVINLAAQAGVRYAEKDPYSYIDSNIMGFMNILEMSKKYKIDHLLYASSSSVYGANEITPQSIHNTVDHPVSLYAATKKSNELMAHCYSHLYELPTSGLRFFTVYGPWGRPDMALFKFTKGILEGRSIDVYNNGNHLRDFTYVDDIVEGVIRILQHPATANNSWDALNPDPGTSNSPWRVYNIGNSNTVKLEDYIAAIEKCLGKKAIKNYLPLQPGDVPATNADVSELVNNFNYKPNTSINDGIEMFIKWYKDYYKTEQ